jgi:hypothetical protein
MARLRFALAQLIAAVLFIGFGFAALRNADEFWSSATSTLAIVSISAALAGAIVRKGRSRTAWIGFAVFGWTYLLVGLLSPRDISFPRGGPAQEPIPSPLPLIECGLHCLKTYINPNPSGWQHYVNAYYLNISHSLAVILFGLVGAVLGRLLAVKDERPNP